ncbi:MAG: hypothetical protein ACRDPW_10795 [Mycobacteriales bacterium]
MKKLFVVAPSWVDGAGGPLWPPPQLTAAAAMAKTAALSPRFLDIYCSILSRRDYRRNQLTSRDPEHRVVKLSAHPGLAELAAGVVDEEQAEYLDKA